MSFATIDLKPILDLTDEQFYELCRINRDIRFERDANGKIIIMPPTGGATGNRNVEISASFAFWNRQTKLGVCFDSSTGFKLPNGATRSPDVAWVKQERWQALTAAQRETFPPLAPDFVLELMSPSDSLPELEAKMQEYLDNGVQLGWLIDPQSANVHIDRQGQPIEILAQPTALWQFSLGCCTGVWG